MKKQLIILISFIAINLYGQDEVDIGTPTNSPFNSGTDIQGTIQNSVNEVTGKVTLSQQITSIASASISYNVSLGYNGQVSFENGKQTNKYKPTSIVGVGWSMAVPKIVVDHKNTGARDDDEFYLQDGATNTKLICAERGLAAEGHIWEFQMEKYAPWKIEYHFSHYAESEFWKITKEDGIVYYFGHSLFSTDAKETIIRYGNWIGSSNQSGGNREEQAIVWNLWKVEDQWGNNLVFEYDKVNQTMSGYNQTEASYLKKIISSKGANIQLTYGTKNSDEYYESHQEASEPDAYQERYEKKYLQSVSSYNNENQLVSTYNIGYTLNGTGLNKKRYLTSLTQTAYNNGINETLPAQTFEYHYTGDFKGGMKKITYPTGGSVTYNYKNKLLFNNSANKYASNLTWPSGYQLKSRVVKDNYVLYLLRTTNPITGNKYRFKVFRLWWDGDAWEQDEFTFPHLIEDANVGTNYMLLDFYVVMEDDFYGFVYDKGSSADVYLFHLEKDGRTWDYYTSTSRNIGNENPSFVSGNGFAALQGHRNGQLYTYVWNGSSWNYKLISQGSGQYYIGATNNYIISLDEDGGTDMITNVSHEDNYYMHYLDAEKNWQTRSWSAVLDPYIAGIEKPSYFYPDNSIIGFVADDNPELFLRWNTTYHSTNVDNVLGAWNDSYQIQSVASSMFTLYHPTTKRPYKSARFNGVNWKVETPTAPQYGARLQFGIDFFSYANSVRVSNQYSKYDCKYYNYDPNTNSWVNGILYAPNNYYDNPYNPINSDFMVVGKKIFHKSNQGASPLFNEIQTLSEDNKFAYSDGLGHTYIQQGNHGKLYYIDKYDGSLKHTQINNKSFTYFNSSPKFGGNTPFMSSGAISLVTTGSSGALSNLYLYKIIDDGLNNNAVYDIVVNHIDINDDNGSLRKVQYTYNKPKCSPDNNATFYGEVILENKGMGTGNIGKIVKKFNDGSEDLTMVGLPLEVITKDANNNLVKKTTMTWNKYTKPFSNGSHYFYNSYYIRQTKEKEELFFNSNPSVISETTNTYNIYGLKTSSYSTNSKGKQVRQNILYAYQNYTFVDDKNMLSFPYRIISKVNGQIVNVKETKWINNNGKTYINETWSGPSISLLRLNSKISKVESTTGNVLESNNGKGLYNAVLFGYDDLYEVATISNAKYQDVVNQLDVTYAQLQNLSTASLKTELLKLYDRLPNASVTLTFYDDNGRVISRINERKEESFVYYDTVGRQDYITDAQGNVLEKKNYHFAN